MANTQLTQTGAQVQADLDKVEELANIKTIGRGLSLSNAGELSASDGMDIIEITTSSGTLSASDLAKLGPNSLIKYTHGGIVDYLAPESETTSINHIYYATEKLGATRDAAQVIEILRIDINKSTGSYTTKNLSPSLLKSDSSGLFDMSLGSVLGISGSSTVKKEDASHFRIPSGGTAGQVLTKVDGTNYNAKWADASGGGLQGYNLTFFDDTGISGNGFLRINDNNKLEYIPYTSGTTVTLTNVIAIVNKSRVPQTISGSSIKVFDTKDKIIYTQNDLSSGTSYSDRYWVLLMDSTYEDLD